MFQEEYRKLKHSLHPASFVLTTVKIIKTRILAVIILIKWHIFFQFHQSSPTKYAFFPIPQSFSFMSSYSSSMWQFLNLSLHFMTLTVLKSTSYFAES